MSVKAVDQMVLPAVDGGWDICWVCHLIGRRRKNKREEPLRMIFFGTVD